MMVSLVMVFVLLLIHLPLIMVTVKIYRKKGQVIVGTIILGIKVVLISLAKLIIVVVIIA